MRKPFKRILILLTAAAVLVLLGIFVYLYIPAPKEEGVAHLQPSKLPPPDDALFWFSIPYCRPEPQRPGDLIDLPKGLEEDGLAFFRLPLGRQEVLAAVRQARGGWGELWIDTNLDRRLADEAKIIGMNKGNGYDFGTLRVGSLAPVAVTAYGDRVLSCRPAGFYIGKIRLNGSTYYAAAIDGDYDGRLSTTFAYSDNARCLGCDIIAIDWNRTGRFFHYDFNGGEEVVPLGRYVKVNDQFYAIETGESDWTLSLNPAQPEMGTLKISSSQQLSTFLRSDAASIFVTIADEVRLPAGRYQMESGAMNWKAETGEEYSMYATFEEDNQKGRFEIQPNAQTTLTYGPPFDIKANTFKIDERTIGLSPTLRGIGGEEYGLQFTRTNARARRKEPVLSILDENGTVIESGKMEFG